jgi:SAM-dependent methyltransferase
MRVDDDNVSSGPTAVSSIQRNKQQLARNGGLMAVRQMLGSVIRGAARLPLFTVVLGHPAVRARLRDVPGFSNLYSNGWSFAHPFDRFYRINTGAFVASENLVSSPFDGGKPGFYAGSQPSIIRTALRTLPALERFTFVDLGCGKGRPLIVASEFGFRAIVGVELSDSLAAHARRNAAMLRRRLPNRVPIRVEIHDASTYSYPDGDLVVFLYNPFPEVVVGKVIAQLESLLAFGGRRIFVVYYNPVHGHCFDASASFSRYFAATLPYAIEELGYGPDKDEAVVIWQAGGQLRARPGADVAIRVTTPGVRAELGVSPS